jgi:hypothetical protein
LQIYEYNYKIDKTAANPLENKTSSKSKDFSTMSNGEKLRMSVLVLPMQTSTDILRRFRLSNTRNMSRNLRTSWTILLSSSTVPLIQQ